MISVRISAPYLEWAKTRPAARFDLAGSNMLACAIADLPGAAAAIGFEGKNDEGYPPLIEAIAQHYAVATDRLTTAQGASGANFLACAALLEPGDDVLVETPGYDPLFAAPRLLGARVNYFERDFSDGFSLDPDRVRRAMTPQTRLVIVTSPHNPSGVVANQEALQKIGRIAEENGARVLVDEVYSDVAAAMTPDAAKRGATAANLPGPFVCTNSLTKSYGLSGLRCGWIISSADVASRIRRARDVVDGSGSIVAERLAVHAFSQLDRLLARATATLKTNSGIVRSFLQSRTDLDSIWGTGTVVFPRLRGAEDSNRFAERLLAERDTAVVPGRFFQASQHFRLGFGGDTEKLRAGLEALGAALDAGAWI